MSNIFRLCTFNARSIKNKDQLIRNYILDNSFDISVITETWIGNSVADDAWCACSNLNNNGLNIITSNRSGRRGGGLAIVSRDGINVVKKQENELESFQYAIWEVNNKSSTFNIMGLYRPPYSNMNKTTIKFFTNEVTELITELITTYNDLIITGDFNIHANDTNDTDAVQFISAMTSQTFSHIIVATPLIYCLEKSALISILHNACLDRLFRTTVQLNMILTYKKKIW